MKKRRSENKREKIATHISFCSSAEELMIKMKRKFFVRRQAACGMFNCYVDLMIYSFSRLEIE